MAVEIHPPGQPARVTAGPHHHRRTAEDRERDVAQLPGAGVHENDVIEPWRLHGGLRRGVVVVEKVIQVGTDDVELRDRERGRTARHAHNPSKGSSKHS